MAGCSCKLTEAAFISRSDTRRRLSADRGTVALLWRDKVVGQAAGWVAMEAIETHECSTEA